MKIILFIDCIIPFLRKVLLKNNYYIVDLIKHEIFEFIVIKRFFEEIKPDIVVYSKLTDHISEWKEHFDVPFIKY